MKPTLPNDPIAAIFARLDPPLWVVTAAAEGRRGGLIATFVSKASITPEAPRMLVGLGKRHHTWSLVEKSSCFGLHLLQPDQADWIEAFGLGTGFQRDKLAAFETQVGATGCPLLADAGARLECRVESRLDSGDRTIYLASIVSGSMETEFEPLTITAAIPHLSPDTRRRLREDLERDAALDLEAILAWRASSLAHTHHEDSP